MMQDFEIAQVNKFSLESIGSLGFGNLQMRNLPDSFAANANLHLDSSARFLPGFEGLLSLDAKVESAHESLALVAEKSLRDPKSLAQFKENMASFESRAESDHLSAEQVQKTYQQIERILNATGEQPLSSSQRIRVAEQWIKRLSDPAEVTQGWHDTCGYAVTEYMLLSKHPEKATKAFADVVTEGKVTVPDFNAIEKAAAQGKAIDESRLPMKEIFLSRGSLTPDRDASGASKGESPRSFADQIWQVMSVNIKLAAVPDNDVSPEAKPGECSYNQNPLGPVRPSESGNKIDNSGESVTCRPANGKPVYENAKGFGYGGMSYIGDQQLVHEVLSGGGRASWVYRPLDSNESQEDFDGNIKSLANLRQYLNDRFNENNGPVGVRVNVKNPGIMETYLERHPEKTPDQVPNESFHFIAVNEFDPEKNEVKIYNPWGEERRLTVEQLYQAMNYPAGYKPKER